MFETIKTAFIGVTIAGVGNLFWNYFKLRENVVKLEKDIAHLEKNMSELQITIKDIHEIKTALAVVAVTVTEMNKKLDKPEK